MKKISWTFVGEVDMTDVEKIVIEFSPESIGPWDTLAEVGPDVEEYVHETNEDYWYRVYLVMPGAVASDTSIPKRSMSWSKCIVSGYIADPTGEPVENETLHIRAYDTPQNNKENFIHAASKVVRSGEDGFFYFELIRNSVIKITAYRLGIEKDVVVPDEPFLTLDELFEYIPQEDQED